MPTADQPHSDPTDTNGPTAVHDDGSTASTLPGGAPAIPTEGIYVRFMTHPKIPSNVRVTITPTIAGDTYPPIVVTRENQPNAVWEVSTDKYIQETEFSYTITVEVDGPSPTDEPVIYSTLAPVKVPIPQGSIKYVNPLIAPIPAVPPDKFAIVKDYITRTGN
jgi:hypothetical protein